MNFFAVGFLFGMSAVCVHAQSALYGQCGGIGWTGATTCVVGSSCQVLNAYYFQCLPVTSSVSSSTPTTSTTISSPSTAPPTTTTLQPATTVSSTTAPSSSCAANAPSGASRKLQFAGVNIAGFDFGCNSEGTCNASGAWPPLLQYFGHDGAGQMQHFVKDDGYNVFRLPVGWQFLTQDAETGNINASALAEYDALAQACLSTGASCIIDVHNYARFNGQIIGQGGPSNEIFATLWSNIATKYATTEKVIFGVMNEPHDIPDINLWAGSVQAAVTAIRQAGAKTQLILLPGDNWTSAQTFVSGGSAAALSKVVNPDGSTKNLVFDVHKYLDSDNSGTHPDCVTNNIADAWEPLIQWLRCNGRQAFNTETGGGNTANCVQYMCEQIAHQAQNSDVILGYVGWAAGNFDPSYVLSEIPTNTSGVWTDTLLVQSCLAPFSGSQSGPTS